MPKSRAVPNWSFWSLMLGRLTSIFFLVLFAVLYAIPPQLISWLILLREFHPTYAWYISTYKHAIDRWWLSDLPFSFHIHLVVFNAFYHHIHPSSFSQVLPIIFQFIYQSLASSFLITVTLPSLTWYHTWAFCYGRP